jgi:flagellar hook-associated protein 3 FlgL
MSAFAPLTPYIGNALGTAVSNSETIRTQLNALTEQASSGKVADTFAGLGSGASTSLSLNAALGQNQALQNGINAVSGPMQVQQTALSEISSIASNFYSQTDNLNGLDPGTVDSVAASAKAALQQMAGLLDSQDGGVYVFAGQDSENPPVPNPDQINSSGFATQIAAAVSALATNGAAATASTTLAIAESNAPGTSPFSAALSQPASILQALRPSVSVGDQQSVPTGIVASANSDATSLGTSTTGSYMRDIMRALSTLGSLSSAQVTQSGFAGLVADTRTSLGDAITALNQDAGIMGNRQAALTQTTTDLTQTATALQGQVSNVQDVDMASTLTQLTRTQTQMESSYQIIAGLESLSLTKYL